MPYEISKEEFAGRIVKIQEEMAERGLDALVTFGNEAEPQNVRYLSDYWPAFESAGVVVPLEGEPVLVIGPESLTYARDRSKIKKIRQVLEYRESSEPEYPGTKLDTFEEIFEEISSGKGVRKLGIVGYPVASVPIYEAVRKGLGKGQILRADDILIDMRKIKSESEINLIKQAYIASKAGIEAVLDEIKPGMTELEVAGVAQRAMYENGAEYEGHPLYVLSGDHSNQAISRPTHRKISAGEVIQLNIGARVGGYSSSIGRPVCLGNMPDEIRSLFKAGLESTDIVRANIRAGSPAKKAAESYLSFIKDRGYSDWFLYGPCHGVGLLECEHPWVESNSDYLFEENMTFQVDCFLHSVKMGTRWEDGIRITSDGIEELCTFPREIINI